MDHFQITPSARIPTTYPRWWALVMAHSGNQKFYPSATWLREKRLKTGLRMFDLRVLIIDEATREVLFDPRDVLNDEQAA